MTKEEFWAKWMPSDRPLPADKAEFMADLASLQPEGMTTAWEPMPNGMDTFYMQNVYAGAEVYARNNDGKLFKLRIPPLPQE